jgi:beta-mannosidase
LDDADECARAWLDFDGVDYEATVLIDGIVVGHHEGVFVPFRLEVSEQLASRGGHILAVVVHPVPPSESQSGRTARVRIHKSRMGYGWDFCPRMVNQGIWRPVTLRRGRLPVVPAVRVSLNDAGDGVIELEPAAHMTLRAAGEVLATTQGNRLEVQRPRLWWPNGAGEAFLHDLQVETGGTSTVHRIGFRRVELVANEGAPADARGYTFVVNGRRLYAKGWNWVPIDPLYGVPRPAKCAHLLRLAVAAHVNLLRVWGGGLVETREFYNSCDELGLMVWQEFSMSSSGIESVPADDPAFVALMANEARCAVERLRSHASLVLWCGGNELAERDDSGVERPLDDSTPVLGAIHAVIDDLDAGRAWLPTSPSGPRLINSLEAIRADPEQLHDVHGPWEHQGLRAHYELYDAGTCLFHSEFGVEAMTNRRALEALIDPAHRWPADRSNPVYEHLGAWWNNAGFVEQCFGGAIEDLDKMRRASQHLQYDGLRYGVEASRRRAFRSSGTLPWQLNESYPNAWCTSAVDYWGDPKPAYFGVMRAYEPNHVCASFVTCAWGGQDEASATVWAWGRGSSVTARFVEASGRVVAEETFPLGELGDKPALLGQVSVPLPAIATDVFLLDLSLRDDGVVVSSNRYLMTRTGDLAPLLAVPRAGLDLRQGEGCLVLSHGGGPAALGIVVEDARPAASPGWAVLSDNVIDLLPGETRELSLEWRDVPDTGRELSAEGWNVMARLS